MYKTGFFIPENRWSIIVNKINLSLIQQDRILELEKFQETYQKRLTNLNKAFSISLSINIGLIGLGVGTGFLIYALNK